MKKAFIIIIAIAVAISSAAYGFGRMGGEFGHLGWTAKKGTAVVIPSCGSPNAPDGVVDLSKCSNAWYAAVILF